MNMTQMKLVNSATKFRHGMDKFYQPNSGLRSSRSLDEAIYIYIYIYTYNGIGSEKNTRCCPILG